MFRNMKLGAKLILIGITVMVLPLALVAVISLNKSRQGLEDLQTEQMGTRSAELAMIIDSVFNEEMKLVRTLALHEDIIAAVDQSGADQETGDTIGEANRVLKNFTATEGLGETSQGIILVGRDKTVVSSSENNYIGVSVADREYIQRAFQGQMNAGAVGLNKVTGDPFVPVASPVINESGVIVGAIAKLMDIQFVTDLIDSTKIGDTGYPYIVDETGLIVAHPVRDHILKTNLAELDGTREFTLKMMAGESGVDKYVFEGIPKTCGYAPIEATSWSLGLTLPDEEYLAPVYEVRNTVFIVGACAFVFAFLLCFFSSRSISKPVEKGVEFAKHIAAGDLTQSLDIKQRDEIGQLADALNQMVVNLRNMTLQIQESSEQVASSSEEISASAEQLAGGSQNQASTLEETSAAIEELAASVDQVSDHAQSQTAAVEQSTSSMHQLQASIDQVQETLSVVSETTKEAVERAREGSESVSQVVSVINSMSESSEQIAGIVNIIADIADQTNLLALNASIEAARAGEHGRGFAVVADEVSKLADRSASSTKEIDELIKKSTAVVKSGVEIAENTGRAMESIINGSTNSSENVRNLVGVMEQAVSAIKEAGKSLENINEMSQSISAATEEQASNSKQVSKAIENVNELTQQAASAAEEMSASTEQLSGMAQSLQELVAQFKVDSRGGSAGMLSSTGQGKNVRHSRSGEKTEIELLSGPDDELEAA